jgi:hypothetical protein
MSNREIPQVVKNLQKARARMAMHGMARYQFINDNMVCMMGAIFMGEPKRFTYNNHTPEEQDMMKMVYRSLFNSKIPKNATIMHSDIACWNNHAARNTQDCLDVFDRAIEAAMQEHGILATV